MKHRLATLILLLLFAASIPAQEKTDVVVMKNGDRITCQIVSLEGGILYVKLDYADGTVSLQWAKVARVESNRLFIVKTEQGSVYSGAISTKDVAAGPPLVIEVSKTPGEKVELRSNEVVTLDTTAKKFWQRFNGEIGIGINYAKANRTTQYSLNTAIEYPSKKWSARATFDSNLSASSGSGVNTRNEIKLGVNRILPRKRFFVAGSLGFLESSEQGIGFQSSVSGGLGYYFKNTNRSKISLTGGLALQRTNYTGSGSSDDAQTAVAGIITTQIRFFKFKRSNFNFEASLLPSLSDPGRLYFRTNQSLYLKLYKDLSWNLSFYGNWDTRPPAGLSASDYGTSIGLGWTFGDH